MKTDQEYMNEDFEESMKQTKENFEDSFPKDFDRETHGSHEVVDRVYVQYENWEQYILNHPTLCVDKSLYEAAWKITQDMFAFYQKVALWDYIEKDDGKINDGKIDVIIYER